MKLSVAAFIAVFTTVSMAVSAGQFSGEIQLVPEGCEFTESRICRLDGMLTYTSGNGLVWQTEEWKDGNGESGTTDGASIPKWAQPIIGDQYDESYLKAAIIHDHYCYEENQVRSWRETHRMFHDALLDLGVDKIKAKVMYFAVYWKGPKWVKLVPGEYCGGNCIKQFLPSGMRWEGDSYGGTGFEEKVEEIRLEVERNPDLSIEAIEAIARELDTNNFFYQHGDTYTPSGPGDLQALPTM